MHVVTVTPYCAYTSKWLMLKLKQSHIVAAKNVRSLLQHHTVKQQQTRCMHHLSSCTCGGLITSLAEWSAAMVKLYDKLNALHWKELLATLF